jgi:hypothetical protein
VADPDEAEGSRGDGGSAGAQIRTFLIADVRGYTLFTQERGDEAAAKLAAKFADIAREGVEARGGTLLELRGDEALCVFASAREAIRTAVDLQRRFVEETLDDPELPLTVGIGLDAGEAVAGSTRRSRRPSGSRAPILRPRPPRGRRSSMGWSRRRSGHRSSTSFPHPSSPPASGTSRTTPSGGSCSAASGCSRSP